MTDFNEIAPRLLNYSWGKNERICLHFILISNTVSEPKGLRYTPGSVYRRKGQSLPLTQCMLLHLVNH